MLAVVILFVDMNKCSHCMWGCHQGELLACKR